MKLIMENWREYLDEQTVQQCRGYFSNAAQFGQEFMAAKELAGGDKNQKEILDKLETSGEWALSVAGVLGTLVPGTFGVSAAAAGAMVFTGLGLMLFSGWRSGRNKKYDKVVLDKIFAALCIDPALLDVTDDELEEKIMQEEHPFNDLDNYMNGLSVNDPVPDMNALFIDAINKYLQKTDQSELTDKS